MEAEVVEVTPEAVEVTVEAVGVAPEVVGVARAALTRQAKEASRSAVAATAGGGMGGGACRGVRVEARNQLQRGKQRKRRVPRGQPRRGVAWRRLPPRRLGLLPVRLGMGLGPLLLLVVGGRPGRLRRDGR